MPYGYEWQDQALVGADPHDDEPFPDDPVALVETLGQMLRRTYQGHANGWLKGTADQPAGPLWEIVAADFLYQYLERSKEQGNAAD